MASKEKDDYDSSDDEDYVPLEITPDDDKDDLLYDDVDDDLVNKKAISEEIKIEKTKKNDEVEKKRIDNLWSDFLSDTPPTNPLPSANKVSTSTPVTSFSKEQNKSDVPIQKTKTKTFIFAGEEVEVKQSESTSCNAIKYGDSTKKENAKRTWTPTIKTSGRLANAAKLLLKRPKMSVLDKTDHDWKEFVAKEGIDEDLKSHSRSKDAFLDKQDFLLKADYLQFEKEKRLRQTERSKK